LKRGEGEEEEDADAAAALPHAAAPEGAPSMFHYSTGSHPAPNPPLSTILPRTTIQRFAFERAVYRSMCLLQLPTPPPLTRVWCPFLLQLALRRFTISLAMCAARREYRARPRPPLPYCPASWWLVQDHRATRLGQSMPGALRRTENFYPHSLRPSLFPSLPCLFPATTQNALCATGEPLYT